MKKSGRKKKRSLQGLESANYLAAHPDSDSENNSIIISDGKKMVEVSLAEELKTAIEVETVVEGEPEEMENNEVATKVVEVSLAEELKTALEGETVVEGDPEEMKNNEIITVVEEHITPIKSEFPSSVLQVNTDFVKNITFQVMDHDTIMLNNVFELYHHYTAAEDLTEETDKQNHFPSVRPPEINAFQDNNSNGENDKPPICVPLQNVFVHSCSNCENLTTLLAESEVEYKQKNDEVMELQLMVKTLLKARDEWFTESKIMNDQLEQLKNTDSYENEIDRLKKLMENNDKEMSSLQLQLETKEKKVSILNENVQYLMDENTHLKNDQKVSKVQSLSKNQNQAHSDALVSMEELNKCILEELSNVRQELSNQTTIISNQIIEHFENDCGNVVQKQCPPQRPPRPPRRPTIPQPSPRPSPPVHDIIAVPGDVTGNDPPSVLISQGNHQLPSSDLSQDNDNSSSRNVIADIAPGVKTYNKVHLSRTLIMGDSMISRLSMGNFKDNIDSNQEEFIRKSFNGGTCEEMREYSKVILEKFRPQQLIFHGGTNDISNGAREKTLNEFKIVDDIIAIGRTAKECGTERIFISSILERSWGRYYTNTTKRLNQLLQKACSDEGFIFIDNEDITKWHTSNDGLHMSKEGNMILTFNFLSNCFFTFNPYLCNEFYSQYIDAL